MRWIALVVLSAGCASTPNTDNFNQPFEAWVPRDVRNFVIDAQACGHFSGEEPYDEARKAFLHRMIRKTCTGLDTRKAALDSKYADSAKVRELLKVRGE